MKYIGKGIAIAAIWGAVAAIAFSGQDFLSANFIIGLSVIALFAVFALAED